MKNIAKLLRAHRIFNCAELLTRFGVPGKTDVYCGYHIPDPRSCQPRGVLVYSPSHHTDPKAHWFNHGRKSFIGNRSESMPKALEWVAEKYGIIEWVTSPFDRSDKIPKVVFDAAVEFLKSEGAL